MKIVSCYGGLWRLSDKRYVKLLTDAAAGKAFYLDTYGKQFGQIDLNVMDLDERLAKELLPLAQSWAAARAATARHGAAQGERRGAAPRGDKTWERLR
jgi:hypothetical protein